MHTEKTIAIIGSGVVGTAIGHILSQRGYKIAAIAARTTETLKRASQYIRAHATTDIAAAGFMADVILITTPDDMIEAACNELAVRGVFGPEHYVFHTSGALSTDILATASAKGAKVGCIHPMQAFATIEGAIEELPGSVFGITADEEALPLARQLAIDLGGEPITIRDEDRPIYHAAACAVCNYLVTLVYYGQHLYESLLIPPDAALKAFIPLLKGDIRNIERSGTVMALTGPISRGDVGTVKGHIEALNRSLPQDVALYKMLGRYTVQVALDKGTIDKEKADSFLEIFGGDEE